MFVAQCTDRGEITTYAYQTFNCRQLSRINLRIWRYFDGGKALFQIISDLKPICELRVRSMNFLHVTREEHWRFTNLYTVYCQASQKLTQEYRKLCPNIA